jgi:hypothetical protein
MGRGMPALITNIARLSAGMMLISGSLMLIGILGLFLFFLYEVMTAMSQYTPIS